MDNPISLLLAVWQEVGRHLALPEAVERLAALLCTELPLARVLVRRLDAGRGFIETLADSGCTGAPPLRLRTLCAGEGLARVECWLEQGSLRHAPWPVVADELPGLLPDDGAGDVVAAALGATGLAIFSARAASAFDVGQEELLRALREPLAAALANDRRLHELSTLREAAEADNRSLLARLGREDLEDVIVGGNSGLREVMERVELVARSDTPVLILGETGSGKEVVARAIHKRSPRGEGPFLRVNCGAIPAELIDSELFGHERGSFTGAVSQRKGWFERADGGTLFLDEVGELSPAAQVRLLRILQDGTFQRVGGQQQQKVDVRVVAATHRRLREMVEQGQFRADLWYRIAVFPVLLPALRERLQDIPALADHFALRACRRLGFAPHLPDHEALALLAAYHWPGNVRELGSVLERAAILGNGHSLEVAQALGTEPVRRGPPASAQPVAADAPFPTLDQAMARHIEAALRHCRGRIEGPFGAARLLGINPHTLRARMRKLGIEWGCFRSTE